MHNTSTDGGVFYLISMMAFYRGQTSWLNHRYNHLAYAITVKPFASAKQWTDAGDIIGVRGTVKRTEKGELSVVANEWTMLTKVVYESYYSLSLRRGRRIISSSYQSIDIRSSLVIARRPDWLTDLFLPELTHWVALFRNWLAGRLTHSFISWLTNRLTNSLTDSLINNSLLHN